MISTSQQNPNSRLIRLLIIVLIVAAVIFILSQMSAAIFLFSDVVVLFAVSWLAAFLINPFTTYLSNHPVPAAAIHFLRHRNQTKWAERLDRFRLPHAVAVIFVYLLLLLGLFIFAVFAIPELITQLIALGQAVPKLIQAIPNLLDSIVKSLADWGIETDVTTIVSASELTRRAQELGAEIVQSTFTFATGLASTVVNIFLILTLAFYMNLDGPRLTRQLRAVIPDHYFGRINLIGQSISRTFGGFLRGQLLMALLYGIPAALVLAIARIGLAVVVGIISGFLMLVPLIGAPIAMVLPALTALVQSPQDALWLLIVMTVYQQVLLQVIAPKVMADVVGMPPLLVLLAMLVSMRLMGTWGLIFGIPFAGVLYALGVTYLEQAKIRQESLPQGSENDRDGTYWLPAMGPGCLLIPDLEAPTDELQPVAQFLASQGITALGIEPYRNTSETSWQDWYAAVLLGLDRLWLSCNQVFIVGKGVGGILALHAASELPVAGVATYAVPLTRDGVYKQEEEQQPILESSFESNHIIRVIPLHLQEELVGLKERVHGELRAISVPVLLLLNPDSLPEAFVEGARYIIDRVGTTQKRIENVVPQKKNGESEWESIAQMIYSFFRSHCN